ncbi:MAG: hypothetical protein GTN49_07850 [candidate division Zixibacteria bacterium]|nr:hypothetical protein [candidate division Zixibacteria bacterium]
MATRTLKLPSNLAEEYRKDVGGVLARWAADERIEGILLLGGVPGRHPDDGDGDVLVVVKDECAVGRSYVRAISGRSWLRVHVTGYRALLRELQDRNLTPFQLSLKGAFIALDPRGRLRDALRTLDPLLSGALPKARVGAAASVAAALRDAEAALAACSPADAGAALSRACSNLAALELLNDGVWPAGPCPLAAREGGSARHLAAALWRAGGDVNRLARVTAGASAAFRRSLPAATACIFDFLIKRGGSAAVASVAESLELTDIAELDLVLNALDAYGLVKVGREERPVPGLPGLTYNEPVLTVA